MAGGDYAVRFRDGSGTVVSPVLPTPRLLDEGWRPVEAYESSPANDQYPAIWRVRDDAWDAFYAPDAKYVRVTVERVPYTWTCDHCGRTWTSLDQFGDTFEEYARHKDNE